MPDDTDRTVAELSPEVLELLEARNMAPVRR